MGYDERHWKAGAMANREHLAKIKEGVEAWNAWRRANRAATWNDWKSANPDIVPDLDKADLSEVNLRGANLRKARLGGAKLGGAKLISASLGGADLRGADLSNANLSNANVGGASLAGANLTGANLFHAQLRSAAVAGANFTGASVAYTTFANNDLSEVTGLETLQHRGPSTIGIDTIYKSKGKIPLAFLRGAGVPDNFIEYMGSLAGKALEFYSCFISYSTKDQEFADRLYADLQNKGVRCWFAPHDLKIGDKFQEVIEERIRLYEKLLIILSENSVNSDWVEREVQAAMEKERRSPGDTVLFPIRVDDAVMHSDRAWAADVRRTRHIGDFRKWKDHDSLKNAFERLLRDLETKGPKAA
jgi:uncharacterized protein YjbI with pentapeptide repeats